MKTKATLAALPIAIGLLLAVVLSAASATVAGAQDDKPTIAVTSIDLGAGTVVITNHGDADFDPNGIYLCNFPQYAPIEGADVIPAGGSITVDAAAHGVSLGADDGEFGLYLTSDYESSEAIISYVEWGEAGHQRASVATQAGIWTDGVAEPSSGVLTASVSAPISPNDWAGAAQEEAAVEQAATEETTELAQTGTDAWAMGGVGAMLVVAGAALLGVSRRRLLD